MTPKEENDHLMTTTEAAKKEFSSTTENTNWVLTDAGAAALRRYQYRGQDLSLTYKYVLSPLAEWCVHHLTPTWLAPNAITLTGLLCMIVSYLILWYYAPRILQSSEDESEIPRWVFLLSAIAILLYQTLDNMDGKQARRVGASSPLGLCFDHGCDAINSVFGSVNWMIALALSPQNDAIHCCVMLMGPYALFYFSTWEEYHTGELIMPILNGPNEGLLGAVAVNLISFWCGPSYWHTYSGWESVVAPILEGTTGGSSVTIAPLRNADLLIGISGMCMIQEITLKTIAIVRQYGLRSLRNLLPFLSLTACMVMVGIAHDVFWNMPRTTVHLTSIVFVDMTTDLMLQHMTQQPYQPWRWMMLPLVVMTIAVATGHWPELYCSKADFLLIYTAASGTFLALKIVVTIREMCVALNIQCFSIPKNSQGHTLVSNGYRSKSH